MEIKTIHLSATGLAMKNAAQLLEIRRKKLSGEPLSHDEKGMANELIIASTFGAAAAHVSTTIEEATDNWAFAFLTALVDPLHPDLDYLRVDPAGAEVERQKRKKAAS